ncbi:AfsR/SARP family transcriptional regulator [Lentzea sp. NPDC005914]|uniref:AfsR/SARP family transcriptional regulator n=1 Tax=Lentzea sp. NPDC005914 TaxID=3154572 RepID=UPI0033EBD85F
MRFGILGPLEVWDGDEPLVIGGPQQRHLLAVLVLNANQVVSAERLIEHLWGSRAPASARQLLKGCVLGLRRALRVGRAERLLTRPPGYLLEVRRGECDLDLAEDLAAAAHQGGAGEQKAALLREALSFWRGPVLDGLDAEVCRTEAERLGERRLALLEERIEVELRLGRCRVLVAELQMLVREHPLRERLWAQLMLALYGADRQADALTAYQRIRQSLVEQLGVEPGAVLRRAHRVVLTGSSAESVGVRRRVPAQLPADVPGFVGRAEELASLDRLAGRVLISGTAGVGKSALAVRWAHRVRDRFPDGQLYLDLRGHSAAEPLAAAAALVGLLTSLGLAADELPGDEAGLAACWRTEVAGRRLLLVLDDARSAEQVRPLLPGTTSCLTVVTSRDTLAGLVVLDGAHRLDLGRLSGVEALRLLQNLIGAEVAAEHLAAAALVDQCARLPLALRIVAELAATRALPDLVGDLRDPGDRLDLLEAGDDERASVREALFRSYQRLPATTAHMFLCLGRHDVVDVGAAAALAGTSLREARRDLGRLVRANLIFVTPDGYAMHGLLRDYATHRAPTVGTPNAHPLAAR